MQGISCYVRYRGWVSMWFILWLIQFTSSLSMQASLPFDAEGLIRLVQQIQARPEGAGGPPAGQG